MGRVWKFGNNVSTDEIMPPRHSTTVDPKILAKSCFADVRPEFASNVKPEDLLVGEENFGSGSSRESAPLSIKATGVKAVIAHSFGSIFYRSAVNLGLPTFVSEEVLKDIRDGDALEIDMERFQLRDPKSEKTFALKPLPPFILKIFRAGGIIPLLKGGNLEDLF
jgi:3-isopropylmalate/(R)-2-methylmalate dehydratase small subunit